ncbi:MAG: YheU family protein [Steroidobacteraceae bacterium]
MPNHRDDEFVELHRERAEGDGAGSDPVEVPYALLSSEVLRAVLESVVLREGTDYGERERSLDDKVGELLGRLQRGEARIVFDSGSQTVDLQPSDRRRRAT